MNRLQALVLAALCLPAPVVLAQTSIVHQIQGGLGFGWAVSALSDIDGDGIKELLIASAPGNGYGLYSGRTGQVIHQQSATGYGFSIAEVGDLNGDARSDFAIGNPTLNGNAGTVRVLSGVDGSTLLELHGRTNERFGHALAGVGDLNADGKPEILIGANGGSGRAFIHSGANGAVLHELSAPAAGNIRFGAGVTGMKDLTGDGINDLAVAAPKEGAGAVYLYSGLNVSQIRRIAATSGAFSFGGFFTGDAGDVDADGKHDLYVGDADASNSDGRAQVFSGADGRELFRIDGANGEGVGPGRGAGDVDGDGHADLIVGSYLAAGGGRVRVFSGKSGAVLETFNSPAAGMTFGFDAVGVGDLNNDGKLDFLVGANNGARAYAIAGNTARPFAIQAATTGAWHDAARPGHGFFIQILPGQRMLAIWFAFDNAGQREWFGGVGTYQGNQALIDATIYRGGRFPPRHDPATVQGEPWGTLRFTFTDCHKGMVAFETTRPGFATGSMSLDRITLPEGLSCAP